MLYGTAVPGLTGSYAGFVNGDTAASRTTLPTLSTTATASSHVAGSPYAITASGAVDTDYSISYVAGTLTVTPAGLTITANNQTKVYGAGLPTLTASFSGFVNGDTSASLTHARCRLDAGAMGPAPRPGPS
jgi:MBG domain (YGX type)